jgi:hypothetical protein
LKPSTWQLFPLGKGVVFRSLDITYERARELGYARLADRYERFCLLDDVARLLGKPELTTEVLDGAKRSRQRVIDVVTEERELLRDGSFDAETLEKLQRIWLKQDGDEFAESAESKTPPDASFVAQTSDIPPEPTAGNPGLRDEQTAMIRARFVKKLKTTYAPYVSGYAYVELTPSKYFYWNNSVPRLPETLIPKVASVRTDLDRFSLKEISALMFHGYSSIDHCLRAYRSDWLPPAPQPFNFTFPGEGIFQDWAAPTDEEIRNAACHLSVSGSRSGVWRRFYRSMKGC